MKIPKKITPEPIIEAIVEVKFTPKVPADTILGLVYGQVSGKYKTVERLPILQLPDDVRSQDPNLRFQPLYRMYHESFIFQLGPMVLSVAVRNYPGWALFEREIIDIYNHCKKADIFDSILRVGMRYVNFFDPNVFEQTKLTLMFDRVDLSKQLTTLLTKIPYGEYESTLKVSNMASVKTDKGLQTGSVIDIDTYTDKRDQITNSELSVLLEHQHEITSKLFFSLLTESFLATLDPEYE